MATGNWSAARDAFSAVLEVAEVPEALFGLANALFWLGDLAGTIANCEKGRMPDSAAAAIRCRGRGRPLAGGLQQGYLGKRQRPRMAFHVRHGSSRTRFPGCAATSRGTAYVTNDPVESEALARQAAEIAARTATPTWS